MEIRPTRSTNGSRVLRGRGGILLGWSHHRFDGRMLGRPFGGGLLDWIERMRGVLDIDDSVTLGQRMEVEPVTQVPQE